MNAQHKSLGRLAELSPFCIKVTSKPAPRVPNEIGREIPTDAAHGCVDWYQYPHSRASELKQQN